MGEIRIRQQSPTIRVEYARRGKPVEKVGDVKTGFKHGVDWSPGIRPIVEKGVITGWIIEVKPKPASKGRAGSKSKAKSAPRAKKDSGTKSKPEAKSSSKARGRSKR